MKTKLLTVVALVAAPLLWASSASAVPIASGSQLSISGADSAFDATSVTFTTGTGGIVNTSGSFTSLVNCTACVTITHNPLTTANITTGTVYTINDGGVLSSLSLTTDTFTGGVTTLTITGTGTATLSGFDVTPVNWSFTTQDPSGAFSFSATTTALAAPEPASLALLGSALAGLGFFARRRKAA